MIKPKLFVELLIFGIVGISATLTHYLSALFCVELLAWSVYFANILGYLLAVSVSFFGHATFTFKSKPSLHSLARFVVSSVLGFITSLLVLWLSQNVFNFHHRVSFALVVTTVPIMSYFLGKFWVFK